MPVERDVIIVGAGVVGVCTAYFLAKEGRSVAVLDRAGIASGASYGNAGLLTPSHAIPLPAPGALTNGLKWLLDSTSPFYIRPRFSLDLARWLWRFFRSSSPECVERGMPAMAALSNLSMDLFDELIAAEGIECHFEHKGWTQVFVSEHGLAEYLAEARMVERVGIKSEVLDRAAVHDLEPALSDKVIGGIRYLNDAHLEPGAFVTELAKRAEAMGVAFLSDCAVNAIDPGPTRCTVTTNQGEFSADHVVLAAGYESPRLAGALGIRIPIEPAKGYAIIVRRPQTGPNESMLLGEARIGATPMGPQLRFAGTLELAGNDLRISQHRVNAMMSRIPEYLRNVDLANPLEIWRGMRPCTPDGLPMIGPCPAHPNIIIATGHGMLGVTQGPGTGKVVAELINGQAAQFGPERFAPERFT